MRILPSAAIAAALLLSACGGDGSADSPATARTLAQGAVASATASCPAWSASQVYTAGMKRWR